MKTKRICVIGNVGDGNQVGGQISKTTEIVEGLKKIDNTVEFYNVYGKKPYVLFYNFAKLMKDNDAAVVVLASPGYFKVLPLLIFFKHFFSCELFELVIGGVRQNYITAKPIKKSYEKQINRIFVESNYMVKQYEALGLKNTKYLPNLKRIELASREMIEHENSGFRICTFSRIDRYKGIDTAIDIISSINKSDEEKVYLDIYGPIDKDFRQEFERKLNEADSKYIKYCGVLDRGKSTNTLSKYELLLFATKWIAEGFPGSFIDAFSAGLPILASYRENFTDIIQNHVNGYLINEDDLNGFKSAIKEMRDNRKELLMMKRNALESAKRYDRDYVASILYNEILG